MKTINVLSWGGGTQSTALMLMMLNGDVKDSNGDSIKPDYIIFADTKNEASFLYAQLYKVIDYVKQHYNFDIIVTSKNQELKTDDEIIRMIKQGFQYRSSKYADLFQEHILYFKGHTKSLNSMPFWVVDEYGQVGKTPTKACTVNYKINQIMKELRKREDIKSFGKGKQNINMFIGYSYDELGRMKDNNLSYANNFAPLIDMRITKEDCVKYVKDRLGFTPQSSVCNMYYANTFERVYKIYQEDKLGWSKLLELDEAMESKSKNHALKQNVFMFRWQAKLNKRLVDISMDDEKKRRDQYKQLSIFDIMEEEEQMACMGGCFI